MKYLTLATLTLALAACTYAPTPEGDAARERDAQRAENLPQEYGGFLALVPPPWNMLASAGVTALGFVIANRIRAKKTQPTA